MLAYVAKLTASDKKTLTEKVLKTGEEYGELVKAVLPYANVPTTRHRVVGADKIIEECVDTILCALSVAYDVGVSDETLNDIMIAKLSKWEEIQLTEADVEFPLPYEIHITVERPDDIDYFVNTCKRINVKPIVLDLQNGGTNVMQDVMTSSKYIGHNGTAVEESMEIADKLRRSGFTVVRNKIETVPWHPMAPRSSHRTPTMPKDCYFECHLAITITEHMEDGLRTVCDRNRLHLSRNFFKKNGDGTYKIMATYRSYDCTYEQFTADVEALKHLLDYNGYVCDKVITEFAIYDNKINHDDAWLETKE